MHGVPACYPLTMTGRHIAPWCQGGRGMASPRLSEGRRARESTSPFLELVCRPSGSIFPVEGAPGLTLRGILGALMELGVPRCTSRGGSGDRVVRLLGDCLMAKRALLLPLQVRDLRSPLWIPGEMDPRSTRIRSDRVKRSRARPEVSHTTTPRSRSMAKARWVFTRKSAVMPHIRVPGGRSRPSPTR